jgi:hypothetical protein
LILKFQQNDTKSKFQVEKFKQLEKRFDESRSKNSSRNAGAIHSDHSPTRSQGSKVSFTKSTNGLRDSRNGLEYGPGGQNGLRDSKNSQTNGRKSQNGVRNSGTIIYLVVIRFTACHFSFENKI